MSERFPQRRSTVKAYNTWSLACNLRLALPEPHKALTSTSSISPYSRSKYSTLPPPPTVLNDLLLPDLVRSAGCCTTLETHGYTDLGREDLPSPALEFAACPFSLVLRNHATPTLLQDRVLNIPLSAASSFTVPFAPDPYYALVIFALGYKTPEIGI